MAKDENRRISSDTIDQDRKALVALGKLEGYQPRNPDHGVEVLRELNAVVEDARNDEIHVRNMLTAARARTTAAEWKLHNAMLGVKSEVVVQYGPDSEAVKALGLKKKSERKRPRRSATPELVEN